MLETLLWQLCVASLTLSYLADASPLQVMSAPNVLRVGSPENIFVECQDCTGADQVIEINVKDYPANSRLLKSTSVTLNSGNNFQAIGHITIPSDKFKKDPNMKQYVHLQAQFPGRLLEKVVMVSFQSGYIFIQTDKTIYTPNTKVNFRMFAVNPGMVPIERDPANANQTDSISIEIMTPDGIVLPVETVALKSGLHSGNYDIPEIASIGVWKVVTRFQNNPLETYSADFEVKEYVLPSFEVKLTPGSPFFYVDSEQLDIDILATYLFGKEVDGVAYVVFGVVHQDQKKSFPESLQKVPVVRGEGKAILLRRHITDAFPEIESLTKSSIFVSVSVLTESGSEMVEAQLRGIQIVISPYTIHFKMTPKYFKPGMSFDVSVVVLNPDDSPAVGVPVLVGPGDPPARGLTGGNGMAKVTVNTIVGAPQLEITAKTTDINIRDDRQAYAKYSALPYISTSNNYLHIGVDSTELKLGDNMKINLNIPSQAAPKQDITYLILSRGQLIKAERFKREGQTLVSLSLVITKDMLPSFRIIAYYHIGTNEVVSDSIWVDVKDTCMGVLKLESVQKAQSFGPRKRFDLKVTGDPGAMVGLVAVDKGIYVLNNKHRLTQKKVWDLVEKYDTGCTAGGGKDSMGVFYDAGLLFETNTALGTPYRQELKCPVSGSARRKRSKTITDLRQTLAGRYPDKLLYRCCVDGMKDTPLSYDCQRRSEYISDGAACTEAFLYCCTELTSLREDRKELVLQLARSEDDDESYQDSNDIVTRTQFPESWLWKDVPLPKCDPRNPHCVTTSFVRTEPLPDSITTWIVTGISLSKTHGICVADSLDIVVQKPFFIDLRLPYSAVRGEQLEVKAILHNNSPDEATVRVELVETSEHLCSAASKRGKYREEVTIGAYSTRSVPFIIIPMKDGHHPIEVKAQIKNSFLSDGIRKLLRVVPEGELIKEPKHFILDPSKHNGKQQIVINSGIPMAEVVVNAPSSTQVSITGGQQTSVFVENAISGDSMGSLIYQPGGCGEQNMIYMTSPVIATTYLDKTNKWEQVGLDKRNTALQHIRKGYENQLYYRNKDGCFSVWVGYKCSTWLTSYVVKVFAMTSRLQVAVQDHVICDAVKWLILNTQAPDGVFKESGYLWHSEMRGDVHGTDSDASMTAFVLIAMQESRDVCHGKVNSMAGSIHKAVAYLEKRMPSLTNPYAVAMTSYALANEEDKFTIERKQFLQTFISDLNHVTVPRGHIYSLEATAYALLALVKVQAFDEASHVVRWFNKQRKYGGGFGSTQATMIVYQAVSEYWVSANEVEYDLDVDILIPGRAKPDSFNINHDNFYTTRTSKIKDVNHNLQVTATGRGEATLTVVSLYYALPKERKSDCQKFNVSVELIPEKTVGDLKTYKLRILVLYKDKEADSSMSILDIGLLTGFTVNTNDLDKLIDGVDQVIAKYEMNTVLSERGSLIIYLNKVSHKRPDEFAFRVTQTMKVGIMQPAAVSVYEYYNERKCVKFYHPERAQGELLTLCKKNAAECTCAEETCSMQKKGKINNDERSAKACETAVDSRIDYVYKARLEQFEDAKSTDIYHMRIEEVIKIGTDMGAQGQLRAFLGFQHCRESMRLAKDRTYLIMGTSKDMFKNDDPIDPGYQYVMGERTWIEYWPTAIECQGDEHRPVCLGLQKLVDYLTIHGCPQ